MVTEVIPELPHVTPKQKQKWGVKNNYDVKEVIKIDLSQEEYSWDGYIIIVFLTGGTERQSLAIFLFIQRILVSREFLTPKTLHFSSKDCYFYFHVNMLVFNLVSLMVFLCVCVCVGFPQRNLDPIFNGECRENIPDFCGFMHIRKKIRVVVTE